MASASPASKNISTGRAFRRCKAPASISTPSNLKPVVTSLDLDATYAVRDELAKGIEKFKAKAGAAAIVDVNTGEVIALASLPDFDPNNPVDALRPQNINRMTVGVYEMGSTFKALTIAMALDAGKVTLNSKLDARDSLRYGRFTIHDFEPQHRFLAVPEVFTYSSNIGTARMAMMVGVDGHKAFLGKMGQLTRLRTELPRIRRAARAEELERAQYDDDRLRPGLERRAIAGADGGRRARQWRLYDQADVPEAQRGRCDGECRSGGQARDLRELCAI